MDDCFAMVCCHQGAEGVLKAEVASQGWRLAFSRPGFVTFKHPGPTDRLPRGVFGRTAAWSLGKAQGTESTALIDALRQVLPEPGFDHLHVWPRDRLPAGEHGYEPGPTELSDTLAETIHRSLQDRIAASAPNRTAGPGQRVLDVLLVDPAQWWFGWHVAGRDPSTGWPGGFLRLPHPETVVSRAYFKAAEMLAWSGFPIRPDDTAVEIGSAPGGACQRLLELGLNVIGIDPAEMDPLVAEHPRFTHRRARGGDLKRSVYRHARWLLVDANVRPDKTLTTVENIVGNQRVAIEGMLLTLKLARYEMAEQIPEWTARVERWGYRQVRIRQLATGRREVCLAARR